MKTSCWHFTKNDCCFWSLYKNNRSVLIKSKTEVFFSLLKFCFFFFFPVMQICLPVANKKKHEYYFGERKNVLWDCVLVEKRYNTSAENNVLREGVWSKKIYYCLHNSVTWDFFFGLQKKIFISMKKKILLLREALQESKEARNVQTDFFQLKFSKNQWI